MPTDLGKKFLNDWRGRPPHMLNDDVPVWYRFLSTWSFLFTSLYYDCLVGGPTYTPLQLQDPIIRMWRQLNSKRIDAVAETSDQVWIIEVARSPGLRSVGQLQVYRSLWLEDPKIDKIELPVLVCESVDQDLISSAARYGISTYVMPPA